MVCLLLLPSILTMYHNKIVLPLNFSPDYDVDYFRQFTIVLNALDNRG